MKTFSSNIEGIFTQNQGKKLLPYIKTEYCTHGDLFHFIYEQGKFSENTSKIICYQILQGLKYLKSNGLSHLDLKPENILIAQDFTVKLCDFGYMSSMDPKCNN